nr:hypothetical protein [Streptomyces spectabilis]
MTSASSGVRSWAKLSIAVGVRDDGVEGGRGLLLADLSRALPGVRRERRDADECGDVGQVARLGDDRAAVGVAHEDHRSVDLPEHLAGALGVVGEGGQRVLHRVQIVEAALLQLHDDVRPVGGAAPESVHQNNGRLACHGDSTCSFFDAR